MGYAKDKAFEDSVEGKCADQDENSKGRVCGGIEMSMVRSKALKLRIYFGNFLFWDYNRDLFKNYHVLLKSIESLFHHAGHHLRVHDHDYDLLPWQHMAGKD